MTGRTQIMAIANQKGGVGKTTSAINLAAAFAEMGEEVLILDLDPQGNASTGLGVVIEERGATAYDLLLEDVIPEDIVRKTAQTGVSLVPATTDLASADLDLLEATNRTGVLNRRLGAGAFSGFDRILIDCPPSLSLLTLNALVAAHAVLIPLQAEFFALEGLSQIMLTIREIRAAANPDLRIEGILLTMMDRRNNLARQVEADARATMGELVFETVIPRNVRLGEAPSFAIPVLSYDSQSAGSRAYRALAAEIRGRQALEGAA